MSAALDYSEDRCEQPPAVLDDRGSANNSPVQWSTEVPSDYDCPQCSSSNNTTEGVFWDSWFCGDCCGLFCGLCLWDGLFSAGC